jgi:hypothetical protein
MLDVNKLSRKVVHFLSEKGVRHSVETFPSGAIMIDIWVRKHFYVLQFSEGTVGFSKVEECDFGTSPDEVYYNEENLMRRLAEALK